MRYKSHRDYKRQVSIRDMMFGNYKGWRYDVTALWLVWTTIEAMVLQ